MNITNFVRARPGMYIGSNNISDELIYEIFKNSFNEAKNGNCSEINIKIYSHKIEISDNGKGINIPKRNIFKKREKISTDQAIFNKGIGALIVNALSSYLEFTTTYENKKYSQTFSCGIPTSKLVVSNNTGHNGTTVSFSVDSDIPEQNTIINYDYIKSKLEEASHLIKGTKITLMDENRKITTFYVENI